MRRVVVINPFNNVYTMQVCAVADATDKEILAVCDSKNPSGTSDGWGTVVRAKGKYAGGPVTCEDHSNRQHFLVTC